MPTYAQFTKLCLSSAMAGLLVSSALVPSVAHAGEMEDAIRSVLRDNPELVFEALRQNPEEVLKIAQEGGKIQQHKALVAAWNADVDVPKQVSIKGRPIKGNPEAPITIVAYSDFACPFCQRAAGTIEMLLKNYKDKVRYVFKNAPMDAHLNALLASQYFVAAGLQDSAKAWAFYENVFIGNDRLATEGEGFLLAVAEAVELDVARLETDAYSDEVATMIAEDQAEAQRLNLVGTPCFLVDDVVVRGALAADLFSEAIEIALKKKGL